MDACRRKFQLWNRHLPSGLMRLSSSNIQRTTTRFFCGLAQIDFIISQILRGKAVDTVTLIILFLLCSLPHYRWDRVIEELYFLWETVYIKLRPQCSQLEHSLSQRSKELETLEMRLKKKENWTTILVQWSLKYECQCISWCRGAGNFGNPTWHIYPVILCSCFLKQHFQLQTEIKVWTAQRVEASLKCGNTIYC